MGADCNIGGGALIDLDVRIGDRCKIQANALIYRGSILHDDVFVGPAACLTNDRFPRASVPEGSLKSESDWTVSGVTLERGSSLGAHVVVVAGCTVGGWALVGAGAVVVTDVSAHALVVGNPAQQIGWVCMCGARLDNSFICAECRRRYVPENGGLSLLQEVSL